MSNTFTDAQILTQTKPLKLDDNKTRFDLLPPHALKAVAQVFTYGANKYAPHNWLLSPGFDYSRLIASEARHMNSFISGEPIDPESNLHHLAHAICSLMMLLEYETLRTLDGQSSKGSNDLYAYKDKGPQPVSNTSACMPEKTKEPRNRRLLCKNCSASLLLPLNKGILRQEVHCVGCGNVVILPSEEEIQLYKAIEQFYNDNAPLKPFTIKEHPTGTTKCRYCSKEIVVPPYRAAHNNVIGLTCMACGNITTYAYSDQQQQ